MTAAIALKSPESFSRLRVPERNEPLGCALGARACAGHTNRIFISLGVAGSLFRSNELERLYRDIRAGAFHPPNTDATHDIIGKTYLGVL